MKKTLLIFTLLLTTSFAFAQTGEKTGEFALNSVNELYIRVAAGMRISITGSDTDMIKYLYEFDGNHEAYKHFYENFSPDFEESSSKATFVIEFPEQRKRRRVNHKIDKHNLIITVPNDLLLELNTRYSQVLVTNINKGVIVENRSGSVDVHNIGESLKVNNQYGEIDVSNITGDVHLSNRSANVIIKEIVGKLTIEANYSSMNISKVDGSIEITNRSGDVDISDVNGDLTVTGPYMDYDIRNIGGFIQMENRSGKVKVDNAQSITMTGDYTHLTATNILSVEGVNLEGRSANILLENIAGDAIINGQYLNIELNNIDGNARIRNRSGKVNIDDLELDLEMNGEYIPLKVKNYKGQNIEVVNRSGSIEIDALNALNQVNIESQYGDVSLNMRKRFNGSVTIESRYGKFESNLELTTQRISTSSKDKRITGVTGDGLGVMIIKNRNADITIKQE